jgi:hypothetical protein
MLRRLVLFILILTASGFAQENWGRMEANLDYGYLRLKVPNAAHPVNMNGVQLGITTNVNRWLGFGADFGAYYHCVAGCNQGSYGYGSSDLAHNTAYTLLVGPRIRLRPGHKWQPFVQGSGGLIHVGYNDSVSYVPSPTGTGVVNPANQGHKGVAISGGGGVDWVAGHFIVRVGQIDFLRYDVGLRTGNTARFIAGIRYQWGMRK